MTPTLAPISLDGFDPDHHCSEYEWGPAVTMPAYPSHPEWEGQPWKDHAYHAEILGWFNHDYLGTHVYIQVWDYSQQLHPDQCWQYFLFVESPTYTREPEYNAIVHTDWNWTIQRQYESGYPAGHSYAQVGADVDQWITDYFNKEHA